MGKVADRYFKVAPWQIIEEGFDPEHAKVAESVFSLGNEYMGVRGYFEEGYSGKTLCGSYFNGIYEKCKLSEGGYKGIVQETEFMVNAVNWLYTRIYAGTEKLDLKTSKFHGFKRVLDLKTGTLTRDFVWRTKEGGQIKVSMERVIPMSEEKIGIQKIKITALDYMGSVRLTLGNDFGVIHEAYGENFWECVNGQVSDDWIEMEGRTINTGKYLCSGSRFFCSSVCKKTPKREEKKVSVTFEKEFEPGETFEITRLVWNDKDGNTEGRTKTLERDVLELLEYNTSWWKKVWEKSDIQIYGDDENQQGIRFCIFQMYQTYHGAREGNNIGAKGLTGESYNGNAFWDTETYCLPFYLFHNRMAARNLLLFRYQTLDEARKRAKELDCKGAFYPIATISGKECCNLWQHASLQLQASTGVAYGIWCYEKVTADEEFIWNYGLEMLVEISRMLASRGDWTPDRKYYGYYCVMGPDEFQMMVNHNCYTNAMGKFTLEYTLRKLSEMKQKEPKAYQSLMEKLGVLEAEIADWKEKRDGMYIPYSKDTQLFEQHAGYFELPHVAVDEIPVEDFPLYHHWSYDRIYRNDMIKQPDVLMLMLLFNHSFTEQQILKNYDFYEPRCIHESSLSPSVHSILASQLKKKEEAFSFFQFATRMDLDDYNRNAEEGLHTTSIAAAWMNIVYGFAGMRSDGDGVEFSPMLPKAWEGYGFSVSYQNSVIHMEVTQDKVICNLVEGTQSGISIYGQCYSITEEPVTVIIPTDWR